MGVESWVTENVIAKDLRVTHRWWYVGKGRPENLTERRTRARVYTHLMQHVPNELYKQLPDGDVRACIATSSHGAPSSQLIKWNSC